MKIIIPMTGYGSRFVEAGYKELKPFIQVQGKPMIEWIVKGMYPNENDFIFICKKEYMENNVNASAVLLKIAPKAQIFAIDDWVKKGPVNDVLLASELVPDNEPCIINYCDFYMTWDWYQFKNSLAFRGCEGAIPCYTGFHPHLLPLKNYYASCLTDGEDNLVEIREKYSFEKDKTKAKHSPGTYYFKSGAILKEYCKKLVDSKQNINGEYYASLPYNFMVEDKLKVWVPTNVDKFCQWGTPEDMNEYLFWTENIRGI